MKRVSNSAKTVFNASWDMLDQTIGASTNISVLICGLNIERGHELENEVANV